MFTYRESCVKLTHGINGSNGLWGWGGGDAEWKNKMNSFCLQLLTNILTWKSNAQTGGSHSGQTPHCTGLNSSQMSRVYQGWGVGWGIDWYININKIEGASFSLTGLHLIRSINDPEHPLTLEQLNVVEQSLVKVDDYNDYVKIQFTPTIPHCSMATLIGLAIRVQLLRSLPDRFKVS